MQMAAQGKWTLQEIGGTVGAPGKLTVPNLQAAIHAGLTAGRRRRARDLQWWLQKEHGIEMGLGGVYYHLGKVGGALKVPRNTHAKNDAAKAEAFKVDLAERLKRCL